MAADIDNVSAMTDEEFSRWMETQDGAEDDEIEVDGTEDLDDIDDSAEDETPDDLEQPYTDSDDNSDDEEVDDETENDSAADDDSTDEETGTEDEQTDAVEEETKTETQPVEAKTYKYNAGGQEFEFTEAEIMAQFGGVFGKAVDYTQKVQGISKYRKMIDAWEQEKLNNEDMNFAIDLLKGDKEAITTLLQKHQVDILELEVDGKPAYTPKNYGRSEVELDIAEVTARISQDPEYEVTHRVLTKDWDDDSWNEMTKRPVLMELLHKDVKSGIFDTINPIAVKLKMQDQIRYGKELRSDLEYYKQAVGVQEGNTTRQNLIVEDNARAKRLAEVQTQQVKRDAVKDAAPARKAAAPTKSKAGTKKLTDYLSEDFGKMSDAEYMKWIESKLN